MRPEKKKTQAPEENQQRDVKAITIFAVIFSTIGLLGFLIFYMWRSPTTNELLSAPASAPPAGASQTANANANTAASLPAEESSGYESGAPEAAYPANQNTSSPMLPTPSPAPTAYAGNMNANRKSMEEYSREGAKRAGNIEFPMPVRPSESVVLPPDSQLNANKSAGPPNSTSVKSARAHREPSVAEVQQLIQRKIDRLEQGQVLFNPPREMRVGVPEKVEARIAKEITESMTEGLEGRGQVVIEPVRIDSYMRVRMNGGGFEIVPDPKYDEEQLVTRDNYTQWAWTVTPESSGRQTLLLNVSVRTNLPGMGEKVIYSRVLEKAIDVHVHPWYSTTYFCKNNWQWLLGTLLGSGVFGFFSGKKFFRAPTAP
jgi:hypothetical protein